MDDDDFLPLSGLQHLVFCERQCALIHVEREWVENDLTLEGTALHARVDRRSVERRAGMKILRGLRIRSERLRVSGVADVVEVTAGPDGATIYRPVEYKHGSRLTRLADDVQLCAQALALEESLNARVTEGAIMYGASRRRRDVTFTAELQAETFRAAQRYHAMWASQETPLARQAPKCRRCSLFDLCLPNITSRGSRSADYVDWIIRS
ncbi:MAG: CRISPR-associated protein Cas4 [Candidatus Eremiobacteraeota bacterium]|nr:CRISPR-associated protein Cas4 [Candidatus Eremiobacteraeota bacterium]MBC5822197.1 CRISPR-associated protein Cas4 [Candidatus Eremiobacteraeota bacterium]